jgi:hypothetical protein
MERLDKKLTLYSGTEFLQAIEDGKIDPRPKFQRHATPSAPLVDSLETDARIGFLCFMFPVRHKEIGDGLRRIQVLESWKADPDKAPWLDNVHIVLVNYDHLSEKAFVGLYVRMNVASKNHSIGDFCKAQQHMLDASLVKFLNRSEFLPDGDWYPFTRNNAMWYHGVVVQYNLGWVVSRDVVNEYLSGEQGGRTKKTVRSSASVAQHLESVYTMLSAMQKMKAKSTASKWAVAIVSDALDLYPELPKVSMGVMLRAWELYTEATQGKHRHEQPSASLFVEMVHKTETAMGLAVGASN